MVPVCLQGSCQRLPKLGAMPRQKTEIDLKRDIGRGIAEARIRRGLTQEDLAQRVGCSIDAVANLERGLSFPRLRMLVALSRQLRVPLRDLLDQVDQTDPSDERRAQLELRGRAVLNQLTDEFLEIAIDQLSVLAKRDRR